jgi:hypothetical protein
MDITKGGREEADGDNGKISGNDQWLQDDGVVTIGHVCARP